MEGVLGFFGITCYNCRFHFVENNKLGCTFPGICHTPDGRKLAYEAIKEPKA